MFYTMLNEFYLCKVSASLVHRFGGICSSILLSHQEETLEFRNSLRQLLKNIAFGIYYEVIAYECFDTKKRKK